jgi:hypothetical protein
VKNKYKIGFKKNENENKNEILYVYCRMNVIKLKVGKNAQF